MTTCKFRFLPLVLLLAWCLGHSSQADMLLFHNGEYLYGTIGVSDSTEYVVLTTEWGDAKKYKRSLIRNIHAGLTRPASGEILRASDFIHSSTGEIHSITAEITNRTTIKNGKKEIVVDVEKGFNIDHLQVFPTTHTFFRRRGSFITAHIQNLTDKPWQGANFRVFVYDNKPRLLTAKDVYVFRLPPVDAKGRGGRWIEMELPDVPFELIHRVRFVRKF